MGPGVNDLRPNPERASTAELMMQCKMKPPHEK